MPSSVLRHGIVELVDPDVHSDVAALRRYRDGLVALVELVDLVNRNIHFSALLVKAILNVLNELFFETFIIHMSFILSLIDVGLGSSPAARLVSGKQKAPDS